MLNQQVQLSQGQAGPLQPAGAPLLRRRAGPARVAALRCPRASFADDHDSSQRPRDGLPCSRPQPAGHQQHASTLALETAAAAAARAPSRHQQQQQQPHRRQRSRATASPACHALSAHEHGSSRDTPGSRSPLAALHQEQQQWRRRLAQQDQRRQQQGLLQLAAGSQEPGQQPKPEPPAPAGAPPPPEPGTARTSSSSSAGSGEQGSSGSSSGGEVAGGVDEAEAAVDRFLEQRWQQIKREIKKELPPEQAAMVDRWKPDDLGSDKVFREMAQHQLGPFLQLMGIQDDPYDFFLDLFRYALAFQLAGAGAVFYGVELGLGGNAGDGLRAVAGLLLGYGLRLGIKVEQLAWPIYNALVQWLIQDNVVYDYPPASPAEKQDTLNTFGLAVAGSFLVSKFAFHWTNEECWQFVVPVVLGLLYFDAAYLFGLLTKLSLRGDGDGGEGGE